VEVRCVGEGGECRQALADRWVCEWVRHLRATISKPQAVLPIAACCVGCVLKGGRKGRQAGGRARGGDQVQLALWLL
jgi:hypothetical protein